MKFTLSWLREYLDTDHDIEEICDGLTRIGLEVDTVIDPAKRLKPFTIARVTDAKAHPNADRLKILTVDTGKGESVQVICGAPNARQGLIGVFARPGDYIPGIDQTLSVGQIRGVESHGMLCSERELEISNEHDGIIELPSDAPIGAQYCEYAGLGDPLIEIELTPNRPDCAGVMGIARDLAAAELGTFDDRRPASLSGTGPCPVNVHLDFEEGQSLCPAFALRRIEGVRNQPSPEWMQKRLRAIGLRPINALVDITNYISFDRGRPLHVFDADKISGDLVVRRARQGEKLHALDEKTYEFSEDMCVIADANGPVSISGIMGGAASGCSLDTTNVLVESALWDSLSIARTGRDLNIISDARYRFERGVDPEFCLPGLELASRLVTEICGGRASEITLAGDIPASDQIIEFPYSEVKRLSGLQLTDAEIRYLLNKLGFFISGRERIVRVATPSWRPDIKGKSDLVEEVVRLKGIDSIKAVAMPRNHNVTQRVLTPAQLRRNTARRVLALRGMKEAVTWSFISHDHARAFGGGAKALCLTNPMSLEMSDMRPSLLPGLAMAARANIERGLADIALFEVGQVFSPDLPDKQHIAAGGIRSGVFQSGGGRDWRDNARISDVFDARADTQAALAALGMPMEKLQIIQGAPAWYHPARSGEIRLGPQNILAHFGELHPELAEMFSLKGAAIFEIWLDALPQAKRRASRSKGAANLSDLMPLHRDFAFVMSASQPAQKLLQAVRAADGKLIKHAHIFDVYHGEGIKDDEVSLAVDVTIQPIENTLTDAQIKLLCDKIVNSAEKRTGARLRQAG